MNFLMMVKSHLLHLGIKVPRQALRDSIQRVDHENTVTHQSKVVKHSVLSRVSKLCGIWIAVINELDGDLLHMQLWMDFHVQLYIISNVLTTNQKLLQQFISGVEKYALP